MPVMDYVNELKNQRDKLADILTEKGVESSRSEKFNTLIPKVNDISGSGKNSWGFKHIFFSAPFGTERTQQAYDWIVDNCSDFFDSVTVDYNTLRISCNIGDTEAIGIIIDIPGGDWDEIYWKGQRVFTSTSGDGGIFAGFYRTKYGFFIDVAGPTTSVKYIPSVGVIKTENDWFFIDCSREGSAKRRGHCISMNSGTTTWNYTISSFNNGDGSYSSKSMPNYLEMYYDNIITISPMLCTNTEQTPTEIAFWVDQSYYKDIGLLTINGHEYFSNGIFCILND